MPRLGSSKLVALTMLNFGFGEILLVMVLAIVVVGPDRLPEMLRFLGKQYAKVTRASNDLRRAFMFEADRADAEERAEALRKRREEARKRAEAARERALAIVREREQAETESGPDAPLAMETETAPAADASSAPPAEGEE